MRPLFQKFQRMPALNISIHIFLVLTWSVPWAVGFVGDQPGSSSLSEEASTSFPKATTEWSTVFEQSDEIPLVRGKLLTTLPSLGKQWRVSLEVFPENFDHRGLANVFQMVTGESLGQFGKCIPAVWMHQSKVVFVSTALGKKPIFTRRFRANAHSHACGNWTQIEVSQSRQGEDFIYAIEIGGTQVYSAKNSRPRDFYDVKVYSSSPSFSPLSGSIRNLKIEVEKFSSLKEGISVSILSFGWNYLSTLRALTKAVTGRRCPQIKVGICQVPQLTWFPCGSRNLTKQWKSFWRVGRVPSSLLLPDGVLTMRFGIGRVPLRKQA